MRVFSITIFAFALLLACFSPLAAATSGKATDKHVLLAGHSFSVEIADTENARERGLMFRTHLAADHGMLFIYPDAQIRNFWMKNTLIPLDILFFDAHKRLINVSADTPPCGTANCPTYSSAAPARYVLELNPGLAKKFGFKPGVVLIFPR
jgi:uncharacterized protein